MKSNTKLPISLREIQNQYLSDEKGYRLGGWIVFILVSALSVGLSAIVIHFASKDNHPLLWLVAVLFLITAVVAVVLCGRDLLWKSHREYRLIVQGEMQMRKLPVNGKDECRHQNNTFYVLYFSECDTCHVDKTTYLLTDAGDEFFVVILNDDKQTPLAAYPCKTYEWKGPATL